MDSEFLVTLLSVFLVGSLWVTLTTVMAERLGSNIGGCVGGLPSVVVVTLFFIGLAQTPQAAVQATAIIPLTTGLNGLLLVVYAFLSRYGFRVALLGAVLVWLVPTLAMAVFGWADFGPALLFGLGCLFSGYRLLARLRIPAHDQLTIHYTTTQMVSRAIFSGTVMVTTVVLSKFGGPILGGSFSAFPVVFISTLVITYFSRGLEFSRAMAKPLMTSGIVNVIVYVTAVRYMYPAMGLVVGTLGSYAIALISGYITYWFISRSHMPMPVIRS